MAKEKIYRNKVHMNIGTIMWPLKTTLRQLLHSALKARSLNITERSFDSMNNAPEEKARE